MCRLESIIAFKLSRSCAVSSDGSATNSSRASVIDGEAPVLVGDRKDVPVRQRKLPALSPLDLAIPSRGLWQREMTAGSEHYYWEKQARSGGIVYRMTVVERSPARAIVATENLSPVRFLLLTLFDPGALQSVVCVERISASVWGAFLLIRTGDGASALAVGRDAPYINRAVAIYRHLAGIPTDGEPPAAP